MEGWREGKIKKYGKLKREKNKMDVGRHILPHDIRRSRELVSTVTRDASGFNAVENAWRETESSEDYDYEEDDDESKAREVSCLPSTYSSEGGFAGICFSVLPAEASLSIECIGQSLVALEDGGLSVPCTVRSWNPPPSGLVAAALPPLAEDFVETLTPYVQKTFKIANIPSLPRLLLIASPIASICSIKWAVLIGRILRHSPVSIARRLADASIILTGEEFRDFLLCRKESDVLLFSCVITKWNVYDACSKAAPIRIDSRILIGERGDEVRVAHIISLALQFALTTERRAPLLPLKAYVPLPRPNDRPSAEYDKHMAHILSAHVNERGHGLYEQLGLLGNWLVKEATDISKEAAKKSK